MNAHNLRPCRALPLALTLLFTLLLAGCGGGGSNGGGSGPSAPAAPLSVSAVTPSGLTATLAESAATVPVGGTVTYTLTLTNDTTQAITYSGLGAIESGSSIIFFGGSVQIVNATGQAIYPPSGMGVGNGAELASLPVTLAPGQSSTGTVAIGGVFTAAGKDVTTATFTLSSGTAAATSTAVGPLSVTAQ